MGSASSRREAGARRPRRSPRSTVRAEAGDASTSPAAGPRPDGRDRAEPELDATDAIDAEVLDDDAFFATLREAVHDETPLGPRDEDDTPARTCSSTRRPRAPGFRDVFRRRR